MVQGIGVDDGALVQEFKCHFEHADGFFDDFRAGGDLRGVGKMGDAGFGCLDSGDGEAGLAFGLQTFGDEVRGPA